jgi:hypothetical protein
MKTYTYLGQFILARHKKTLFLETLFLKTILEAISSGV